MFNSQQDPNDTIWAIILIDRTTQERTILRSLKWDDALKKMRSVSETHQGQMYWDHVYPPSDGVDPLQHMGV